MYKDIIKSKLRRFSSLFMLALIIVPIIPPTQSTYAWSPNWGSASKG